MPHSFRPPPPFISPPLRPFSNLASQVDSHYADAFFEGEFFEWAFFSNLSPCIIGFSLARTYSRYGPPAFLSSFFPQQVVGHFSWDPPPLFSTPLFPRRHLPEGPSGSKEFSFRFFGQHNEHLYLKDNWKSLSFLPHLFSFLLVTRPFFDLFDRRARSPSGFGRIGGDALNVPTLTVIL